MSDMKRFAALTVLIGTLVWVPRSRGWQAPFEALRGPHQGPGWYRWIEERSRALRVGVVEGQREIRFSSLEPFRIECGETSVLSAAGRGFTARWLVGVPARILHAPVVASFPSAQMNRAYELARKLKNKGHPIQIMGTSALSGTSLPLAGDRRRWYVTAGSYPTEAEARTASRRLGSMGYRPWIHERLGQVPGGMIALLDETGQERARGPSIRVAGPGAKVVYSVTRSRLVSRGVAPERHYRGGLEIVFARTGTLAAVNVLGLEEYLGSVVPSEMPASYPAAALQAQAICARSSVLSTLGHRDPGDPYDVPADERIQVYNGLEAEDPRSTAAVEQTRGQVLCHGDAVVQAVFSDTCGGFRESAANVWAGGARPFLVGGADAPAEIARRIGALPAGSLGRWVLTRPERFYCARTAKGPNPHFRWEKVVPVAAIQAAIGEGSTLGAVRKILPGERGVSGRLKKLTVVGTRGTLVLEKELPIRQRLGQLSSACFTVEPLIRRGKLEAFRFRGAGWGHGVGLCQVGSRGRALEGQSALQILQAYFPGTVVRHLGSLPAGARADAVTTRSETASPPRAIAGKRDGDRATRRTTATIPAGAGQAAPRRSKRVFAASGRERRGAAQR